MASVTPFNLDRPVPLSVTQGPLAGLEFTASVRVPLDEYFRLDELIDSMGGLKTREELDAAFREAAEIVGPRLRSWNLETDDGLLPATGEGLIKAGPAVFPQIVGVWRAAVQTGGPSPLASAPTSSASTANSSPSASSRAQRRAKTPR